MKQENDMDQHDVEFQRFLQKLEFSDTVWKQLVTQKIEDNLDQHKRDHIDPQFKHWGLELRPDLPSDP